MYPFIIIETMPVFYASALTSVPTQILELTWPYPQVVPININVRNQGDYNLEFDAVSSQDGSQATQSATFQLDGALATFTLSSHGMNTGDQIVAVPSDATYGGIFPGVLTVTKVDANTFTVPSLEPSSSPVNCTVVRQSRPWNPTSSYGAISGISATTVVPDGSPVAVAGLSNQWLRIRARCTTNHAFSEARVTISSPLFTPRDRVLVYSKLPPGFTP